MTRIIVLAAGQGTRMNSKLPKVLVALKNRSMITYLMDSILLSGVDLQPIVVVSPDNQEIISQKLKDYKIDYAVQKRQLGTGHAVACTQNLLGNNIKNVLVLYGDHPFFKSNSLKKIAGYYPESLMMLTTKLPNFTGWYHNFYHWGRIIRGKSRNIEKIVEFKDASEKEKLITEVNPAVMCFNRECLLKNLSQLNNSNNQKEYYLTALVKIAFNEGLSINSLLVDPAEALGVNSLEELKIAETLL